MSSTGFATGSENLITACSVAPSAIAGATAVGGAQVLPVLPVLPVQPSQCVQTPWLRSVGNGIAGAGPFAPTVEQKSA